MRDEYVKREYVKLERATKTPLRVTRSCSNPLAARAAGLDQLEETVVPLPGERLVCAKELDRVPSRQVEVSDQQEQRVQRLLDENLAISLHDHCFVVPEDFDDGGPHAAKVRTGHS